MAGGDPYIDIRCRPRSEDITTTTTTQRASTAPCSHRAQGILIWLIRMRGRHNNGLGMQTSIYSYKQTSIYSYAQMANSQLGASWHKAHGHLTESGWRCCQAQQEALTASLLQLDLCSGRLKGAVCSACAARGWRQGHSTQCDTALLAEPGGRRVELLG
jgi:hypothetical protein